MKSTYVALATFLAATACGRDVMPSLGKEAPDAFNRVENFSIFKVYSYDDLRAQTSLKLPNVPWADIYWPIYEQGLAHRWTDDLDPKAKELAGEVKLGSFLTRFAGQIDRQRPDPRMSPAEKYDLVFSYRHNRALKSDDLKRLGADLSEQDVTLQSQRSIPQKRKVLAKIYQQFLSNDNLPLNQSMSMTVNSWKAYLDRNLEPQNKYLAIETNPGKDWSWEGHCHGWAPAAVLTTPPKHAVMALIGEQQVLFSEGDLRGLMTKAWADAAPDDHQGFIGRRCYEGKDSNDPIPSNANGRGYSGRLQLTQSSPELPIIVLDTMPDLLPVKLRGRSRRLTVYQIRIETTGERKYLVEHLRGAANPDDRSDDYWLADSFSEITEALKDPDPLSQLKRPYFAVLTGCWDINPASFHEALVEQLAQRKLGFVLNRSRVAEVWNQPVYSAEFSIGPLLPVGSVKDVAAKYRASGTAFVAEVHAAVAYGQEPDNPQLTYPAGYDRTQLTTENYDYTLEFDAKERVIGGEWGTFAKIDPAASSPDFIYAYEKNAVPQDLLGENTNFENASIDYGGIIARLYSCAAVRQIDGEVNVLGKRLQYSNCVIEQL